MFFATELHPSGVYVSQHTVGLFDPSELVIRARKIALHGNNALQRHAQAKTLTRKTMPVARRVLGESHELTLRVSCNFAEALYEDPDATLDDIREAVTMLEDTVPTARRVFGGANPIAEGIEESLRDARAALRAREVLNASV